MNYFLIQKCTPGVMAFTLSEGQHIKNLKYDSSCLHTHKHKPRTVSDFVDLIFSCYLFILHRRGYYFYFLAKSSQILRLRVLITA